MHLHLVSLFPSLFDSFLHTSLIEKAREKGILEFTTWNPRDFCSDKHQQVDDEIYGGGEGMLIKAKPIVSCVETIIKCHKLKKSDFSILFPSPAKEVFTQKIAHGLSKKEHLIFICGRYEGIDYRAEVYLQKKYPEAFRKLSLGQFIVLGGEVPSMLMIEAIVRLIPGVIKEKGSWIEESYALKEGMANLEAPNYTRPVEIYGMSVPEALLSGDDSTVAERRTSHQERYKN